MNATDYLVKGCGAMAMAFVDVMLKETDATFTIVDQRAAPGGHWNDAYPFVRLHQPSSCYGVSSRKLGHGRKDETGFNRGLHELASGIEVADYFHQVMRDQFLPTGRVSYHPVSELTGDVQGGEAELVSLLSGERKRVKVQKKLVDGTMIRTAIPLTHTRKFSLAEGVTCIPPNDLTRLAPGRKRFTILGAGKTAIDSVSWLLANGAAPEALGWVLPRDPWLVNRVTTQPGLEFFEQAIGGIANQYEIFASATSIRELCERMEAFNLWLRLDPSVWPSMMHGATVTGSELVALRSIANVVRLGRVQRLEPQRMILERGEVAADPDTLYVDCTASALGQSVNDRSPVFADGLIRLQMVRAYQPTFSAAMIGHIEATIPDESAKQKLAQVTPMTDTLEDFARMMATSIANQGAWNANADLRSWIRNCRLDYFGTTLAEVPKDDLGKRAILGRIGESGAQAARNLYRLSQAVG